MLPVVLTLGALSESGCARIAAQVWVTENGVASPGESAKDRRNLLKDMHRLDYYRWARQRARVHGLRVLWSARVLGGCAPEYAVVYGGIGASCRTCACCQA